MRSVSPVTARMSNGSMPSTSATAATSTSSDPWPISVAPQKAVTPPLRSSFSWTPECGRSFQLIGQARAGEIRRARQPQAAPKRQLAELLTPPRALDDAVDALGQPDRADAEEVGGEAVGRRDDSQPELRRIHPEPLGDLVELHLLPEAALGRAVPSLGPARRLVGEHAAAAKPVGRDVVGHGLQRAGIEGARDAVRIRRRRRRAGSAGPRP